jgi:predicted metal-dependent peptidase
MQTYNMPTDPVVRKAMEAEAMDRVLKARHELILTRTFYGVLVSHVEPKMSWLFDTAATNGKVHYWNPHFVLKELEDQDEVLFVQAHESEHDARHHGTRRGSREPVEWNVSGDYSINVDLVREGFKPPKCVLLDYRFEGMSAEEIYRTRELERKPPPPEQGDDEQDDNQPGDNADTNPGNKSDEGDEQDGDEGDTGSDDADSDEGDTEGDTGAGDSNEQGDKPGEGAGKGAGEGEGEGEGTGEGGNATGEAGSEAGEGSGDSEAADAEKASGDVGSCGQVLDAAEGDDGETPTDLDHEWEKRVRQAYGLAKAAGQLPGHVTREIERANNPVRAWRDELREFAEQGALRIETWNRPNRRFASSGLFLPSTVKDGVSKAAVLVDTSGSCDEKALACVQDEMQQLMDDGVIDEVVVVYGDTQVNRVDSYNTGDDIEFDPRGGGGTDMQPLFQYVADEHSDATLILCFTDLEFYKSCGEEPAVPVLFAVHGAPQTVKRLMANTPWGARAIDVGVH